MVAPLENLHIIGVQRWRNDLSRRGEPFVRRLDNCIIGKLEQWSVSPLIDLLGWRVRFGVVITEHRPARTIGVVPIRAMKGVGMKIDNVAGIHRHVNKREALQNIRDTIRIGGWLFAAHIVIDAAQVM